MLKMLVKRTRDEARVPTKSYESAAGFDLYSCEDKKLSPGERYLFKIGLMIKIPEGYCAVFKDRSGNSFKKGLHVLAGVIDDDYLGEWGVLLLNTSKETVEIKKGDRIAQALILPVPKITLEEVDDLSVNTLRGEKGFGSSGD